MKDNFFTMLLFLFFYGFYKYFVYLNETGTDTVHLKPTSQAQSTNKVKKNSVLLYTLLHE